MQYSVLMSVYAKEQPEFLVASIESILNQTVKTNNFVIVCDGPLTDDLEKVLDIYKKREPEIFCVVRLKKNMGLGIALNKGLELCINDLVARMDSDDISVPSRMELQLNCFSREKDLAICGGYIAEFKENPEEIVSIRKVPCSNEEISRWAKKRNPLNHMTVMFKKNYVLSAGGYQKMDLAEDYYLWVRMLLNHDKMRNLESILVKARIGNGMYQRRGGKEYARNMIALQRRFYELGFINKLEYFTNLAMRIVNSVLPNRIREKTYSMFLRSRLLPIVHRKEKDS